MPPTRQLVRSENVHFKVTPTERAIIRDAARARGHPDVASFLRRAILTLTEHGEVAWLNQHYREALEAADAAEREAHRLRNEGRTLLEQADAQQRTANLYRENAARLRPRLDALVDRLAPHEPTGAQS